MLRAMTRTIIFSVLSLILLSEASAETPVQGKVSSASEALRSYPGGPLVATLQRNTKVKLLEQKEDFVKISLEGWIKVNSLALEGEASSTPEVSKAAAEPFELTGYEIKELSASDTGDKKRIVLSLKLKNLTDKPVKEWEGLLVVQGPKGDVLFRSGVSSSGEPLSPQGTGSVSFNWKEGEKEYEELSRYSVDQIKVLLLKIVLQ